MDANTHPGLTLRTVFGRGQFNWSNGQYRSFYRCPSKTCASSGPDDKHITRRRTEVFHSLTEAGSIARTSERLILSRPAVSIALSNLERELGFRQFPRAEGYFAPASEALLLHREVVQSPLSMERVQGPAR